MSNFYRHETDSRRWVVFATCAECEDHLSVEIEVVDRESPLDKIREMLPEECPVCSAQFPLLWESEPVEVFD